MAESDGLPQTTLAVSYLLMPNIAITSLIARFMGPTSGYLEHRRFVDPQEQMLSTYSVIMVISLIMYHAYTYQMSLDWIWSLTDN